MRETAIRIYSFHVLVRRQVHPDLGMHNRREHLESLGTQFPFWAVWMPNGRVDDEFLARGAPSISSPIVMDIPVCSGS